jgi:ATP-binding cassette, subfamily B, bacterial
MFRDLKFIATRLRGASSQLRYVPRVWALVWSAARGWNVAWLLLIVLEGLLPVAIVQLTRLLVNSLFPILGHGRAPSEGWSWPAVFPVLCWGGLLAGALLAVELLRSASNYVRDCQGELLQDHIARLVHQKSASVDLAFFDWPEYYDHLHRAKSEATRRPVVLVESLGSLARSSITLIAMAGILIPFGAWLPAILLVSTVPAFVVVARYAVVEHRWWERATPDERRSWYYDWMLTSRETAAELRLFGWGEHFRAVYQTLRKGLREGRKRLARRQVAVEVCARVVAVLVTAGAAAWMVLRAIDGLVGPGDLVLFYQVFNQGQRVFEGLLQHVGQVYYNILFLHDLFEFLDLRSNVLDAPTPAARPTSLLDRVRFRDVRFKYPGSNRFALEGLTLDVAAGRIAAIVGTNGSGKSTLVKLLCRFYDPDEGLVEWDGTDLRNLRGEDLRRMIAVLFQQPFHHQGTVAENIVLGDLSRQPDRESVRAVAHAAEAESLIAELSEGFDQLLGTWFRGGVDLSVGEWQRLVMARTYFRDASLFILDEPSSAMDPWTECTWFSRFREFLSGRTALLITHRLTTARHADVIHVLDHGRVAESGTHEDLILRGGRYAQAWSAQSADLDPLDRHGSQPSRL